MTDTNYHYVTEIDINVSGLSREDRLSDSIRISIDSDNNKNYSDEVRLFFKTEEYADRFLETIATAYHQRQLFKIKQQQESEES
jgi:hypothetical protein